AVDQEVRLGGAQLDLQRPPRFDLDPRHVGDVQQVGLQRVDVLADPHQGRPPAFALRTLSAGSCRNTAAVATAAWAPASAASMMSVGVRMARATTWLAASQVRSSAASLRI